MHTILEFIYAIFGDNPDWKQVFLIGMTPIFLIAVIIEYTVMRRRNGATDFDLKDVITNLSLGGTYQIVEVIYHFIFLSFVFDFFYHEYDYRNASKFDLLFKFQHRHLLGAVNVDWLSTLSRDVRFSD